MPPSSIIAPTPTNMNATDAVREDLTAMKCELEVPVPSSQVLDDWRARSTPANSIARTADDDARGTRHAARGRGN